MKNNLYLVYLIFATTLTLLLQSCTVTYGDETQSRMMKFENTTCGEKPDRVHLFFESEKVDFEYQKIGLIEVEGNENAYDEKLISHLKYQAWQYCADAVIGIETDFRPRETGLLTDRSDARVYSSKVMKGIAVKVKKDSIFNSKYQIPADTSFVSFVRKEQDNNNEKLDYQVGFSYLIGVLVFFGVIVALALSGTRK